MKKNQAHKIVLALTLISALFTSFIGEEYATQKSALQEVAIIHGEAEMVADDSGTEVELVNFHYATTSGAPYAELRLRPQQSEDSHLDAVGQDDLLPSQDISNNSTPSSPLLASAVNILNGRGRHVAIGTKINDDTILTHNHQKDALDLYTIVDSSMTRLPWLGAKSDPVGAQVEINGGELGPQTRLVTFDRPLAGAAARVASQRTIRRLKVGDPVEIVYWDDDAGQLTVGQFVISNIDNLRGGVISVADPQEILNIGDSGGGVFFEGQLIGNTWSVVGGGHIALVPPRVNEKDRAASLVEPTAP